MKKESKPTEFKCPKCGLECGDATSLKRHIDWSHPWETEGDKKI